MARLAIVRKGRKAMPLDIPEGGLRFGRHQLNNLVIEGVNMPLFLGRFHIDPTDGSLWLTRFTNDDHLSVDNRRATTQRLEVNQVVRIGNKHIRVLPAENEFYGEEKFASFRMQDVPTMASPERNNKAFGLVALLLLICLFGTVTFWGRDHLRMWLSPHSVAAPSLTLNYVEENSLVLFYQQLRGDDEHMIRYSLELNDSGVLSVQLYDLITDHAINAKKLISDQHINHLSSQLFRSGFFKASEDSGSACNMQGNYAMSNIIVERGGKFHEVKVFNNVMPVYVKQVIEVIEQCAARNLRVPLMSNLSNEQLSACLEQRGEEDDEVPLFNDEYFERLHASIRQLIDAENYLSTLEPSPLFHKVVAAQQFVTTKLDSSYGGGILNETQSAKDETKARSTLNPIL